MNERLVKTEEESWHWLLSVNLKLTYEAMINKPAAQQMLCENEPRCWLLLLVDSWVGLKTARTVGQHKGFSSPAWMGTLWLCIALSTALLCCLYSTVLFGGDAGVWPSFSLLVLTLASLTRALPALASSWSNVTDGQEDMNTDTVSSIRV